MEGRADTLVVEGGRPIGGVLAPAGNKNEALPAIAAAALASGVTQLENVPRIADVDAMLEILASTGAQVKRRGPNGVDLDTSDVCESQPDPEPCSAIRASLVMLPTLLHRTRRAILPRPGGDRIGRRRVDTSMLALQQLGAEIEVSDTSYDLKLADGFTGHEVFLDEASVMATEATVMAAAVARGPTAIVNAASEPHVQGLCRMLIAMGARIEGVGTNCIEIEGVPELHPATHRIGPDHIEIGSFAAIAAMTRGELVVTDVEPADLRMIRMMFARLGVRLEIEGRDLHVPAHQELVIRDDLHGALPAVADAPWPGFPADLTPIALALATQSRGTVLIHEKMFESRLFFVDRLIAMGARVVLCDPHRAVVIGPSTLHGGTIASPDIRAGMALLAAALTADGRSEIMNAHQVDRGYEDIEGRLISLGASIHRI